MNQVAKVRLVQSLPELKEVIANNTRTIALVYASWCPYCIRFLPAFNKQAEGRADFLLVQDDREEVADVFSVEVFPTVLVFEDGSVTQRLDGVLGVGLTEDRLVKFLESNQLI